MSKPLDHNAVTGPQTSRTLISAGLPEPLAPMGHYAQFIGYRLVWDAAKQKNQKKPVHCQTGRVHSPVDPAAWGTFEQAAAIPNIDGVGFVFTEADPFWFLDIDHAWDGSQWSDLAQLLCQALAGCAVEVSDSGTGLHVIGTGPAPAHGCRNDPQGLEFYTADRFVALTGKGAQGSAAHNPGGPVLDWLVASYFAQNATRAEAADWTDAPVPEWNGYTDDGELLAAALRAQSASAIFGDRASFGDLWTADPDALARAFPDGERAYNASQADAALAMRLLFWTGKDCARTLQLMEGSALVRDKWADRDDYLERTILAALSACTEVHQRARPEPPQAAPRVSGTVARGEVVTGYRLLAPDQQVDYFAGCVYVQDQHKIFTPWGDMLGQGEFRAMFGGYTFAADSEMRRTTRNAWEAFTESQAVQFPKVVTSQFRPDLESGAIIDNRVNTYVPSGGIRKAGDPTPFLDHVAKLLPDPEDREIFLSFLAACVQRTGAKFQWAPVLIGAEGCGKTLLFRAMAYALGERYCHTPNAADLANKFNAWISRRLLVCVEEVHTSERLELIEALKPLITNSRIEYQAKGQDQTTGDNCANFLLFSNHRDAIHKTQNDRRFCVLYTAQQEAEDLTRDGMDGQYFLELHTWLAGDGLAIVADYLAMRPICVDVMGRAPETTSTTDAIRASLGVAEQILFDAIDLDHPGFCGGLICTQTAAQRLTESGRRLSPQRVAAVLKNLGYVRHPALEASAGKIRLPNESKPRRLYVLKGSLAEQLSTATSIATHWIRANSVPPIPTRSDKLEPP